jgi:hypothetical protein
LAKEQILRIRNADVVYDELMKMYEEWEEKLNSVETCIIYKPNWNWANDYLINTLKKHILSEG